MNELSKYLCLLLRHNPEKAELDMDEHGWVSVEQLINVVNKHSGYELKRELLKQIVAEDNKKRYEFDEENDKIRIVNKKLKLIYFYSQNIRGFKDNEFNFSSKYKMSFSNNILTISCGDERYIEDFYGGNLEINAIVGNNGSGKSSLLKRIYSFLRSKTISWWGDSDNKYIVVFEEVTWDNSRLKVVSAGENNKCYQTELAGNLEEDLIIDLSGEANSLDLFDKFLEDELTEVFNLDFEMLLNLKSVYITQVLDREMYNMATSDRTNLSTGGLIKVNSSVDSKKRSEVVQYFHSVFLDQIDFVNKYCYAKESEKIELPFSVNGYVKIRFDYDLRGALEGLMTKSEHDKYFDDEKQARKNTQFIICKIEEGLNINRDEPSSVFAEALLALYLIDIKDIYDLYTETVFSSEGKKGNDNDKSLFELIKQCVDKYLRINEYDDEENAEENDTDSCKLLSTFLNDIDLEFVVQLGKDNGFRLEVNDIIQRYRGFLNKLVDEFGLENVSWRGTSGNDRYLLIPMNKEKCKDIYCGWKCDIKEFYDAYKKVSYITMFLDFEFGLSSGEEAMLDLYCKFYKIYKLIEDDRNRNITINNLVLLIDEADMLFHPQWQKDYIQEVGKVAEQIFWDLDSVQIFLASHSPIMLSDIPRQNVIYLKKDNKDSKTKIVPRENRHETFGANIFRLFQDTFFLEKTGIGSFAEKKMVKLLEDIHKIGKDASQKELDRIKKHINIIGDPYLKRNFELEYYKYLEITNSKKYDKEWRTYLEEQLRLLDAGE